MTDLCALLLAVTVETARTPAEIAKRVGPAVVLIKMSGPGGEGSASGFVVDPSGTIVTNLHVVQGATAIGVKFPNGDIYDTVRIRAFDERKDLVVLQIPGYGLPTVELGDSDAAQAGDPVVLIGNPLGVLEGSVSTGVVSGIRTLENLGFRVIQTDAAANPGNSGGPLLNSSGRVIGVLSFKLRGSESLNFVVPINYVRGLLASPESLNLEELATRTKSATDVFGATRPQYPSRWKSLASGTSRIVRVDGDNIYVDTVFSDAQREAGFFSMAELRRSGDRYVGHVRGAFVCSWMGFTPFVGRHEKVNRCDHNAPMEITLLTPTRIEGVTESYPPNSKFDCGKCRGEGRRVRQSFTWIPE
jgi:S1-C subfamily serine protease